ncbi:MAG: 7,8-dihydropterin-6-yl-methyl-4-(beta-D-ribofuranosyl)aminobenzene 5'-phosphate synthase [Syntrophus sp. SKADARSKE-3]|nr:7,8-dihydropterin-6-yl-methyl-4-(beta-D-ribofuranosyl)aminobenzene 5'-phosphate synthase [Syntrophus sp. SKADARSKE-3]
MTPQTRIKEIDNVEILTLQDNYIDLTAMDNNDIVKRASPLQDGQFRKSILSEHGFSAFIRTKTGDVTHTILLDTGFSESGALYNANALGADLSSVEAVAISHGHLDHTGGFELLAAAIPQKGIPVVAHPYIFRAPRYLKISENFKINMTSVTRDQIKTSGMTLVETKTPLVMPGGDVLFLGEIPRRTDFEKGFPIAYYQEDGVEKWDPIEDDTSLVMNLRGKGLIIVSGCAHSGIVNTVRYAKEVTGVDAVYAVMGGFHLGGPFFEAIIGRTTEELKKADPTYIIPTHCTGRKATAYMEKEMPERFILNMSGTKLTFTA